MSRWTFTLTDDKGGNAITGEARDLRGNDLQADAVKAAVALAREDVTVYSWGTITLYKTTKAHGTVRDQVWHLDHFCSRATR